MLFRAADTPPIRCARARALLLAALATATVALASPASSPADSDGHAPSQPANILLAAVTQTSVDVTWTASTDDLAVAGYRVYIHKTLVGSTPTTRFSVVGLSCGTTYTIGIEAYDGAGNSSARATVLAATSPCYDAQSPAPPAGITQVASTDTSATISWSASTDNVGVVGYHAFVGGVEIGRTSETSYTFTGLDCGKSTTVSIDAYDAAGNRSSQTAYIIATSSCGDTHAPSPPTGISLSGNTEQSISLTWTASHDDVGVARYAVFLDGAQVASTAQTAYTIPGLTCGTSYTVGVAAADAAGNWSAPATVIVSTSRCARATPSTGSDEEPPSVPANLAVSSTTETSVTLIWTPSTDNLGVSGYGIYEGEVLIGETTLPGYALTGLRCGTSTSVSIDAYDAAGNRSAPAVAIVSTSPCSDTIPPASPTGLTLSSRTATSISVTWAPSSDLDGVTGYDVYRGGAKVGATSATTYTLTGLTCGTSYTIGVDAYDGSGNRSTQATVLLQTAVCGDTQPPSAPSNLTSSATGQTGTTLSWTAASDNVGVAGYDVFVGTAKVASTTTQTTYTITGLSCATSYTLGVEAYDAAGNRSSRASKALTTGACSGTAGSTLANLWIDKSGGSCSRSATASSYVDANACGSLDAAYAAASLGDNVLVKGGAYGAQCVTDKAGKDTSGVAAHVVFQPAAGETVTFSDLGLGSNLWTGDGPDHITIRNISDAPGGPGCGYGDLDDVRIVGDDANDITLENWDGGNFYINGAQNITIKGGDWGPCVSNQDGTDTCGNSKVDGNTTNANITIDGASFHDYVMGPRCSVNGGSVDCHFEALILFGPGPGFVLRNSRFYTNEIYDVMMQPITSPYDVRIENNWFGLTRNQPGNVQRGTAICFCSNAPLSNVLVRYNSFAPGESISSEGGPIGSNVRVVANIIGKGASCYGNVSYAFNTWTSSSCSASDRVMGSLPYVNASAGSAMDYHLSGLSLAIDAGDPSDYPASDLDGDPRPLGAAPDAGADEKS